MKNIFLVLGYGIPKNIFKDENYNFYLKTVFNKIYDIAANDKAMIICSGGKTDCCRPYKRIEADEMIKFLKKLTQRKFVKKATKDWSVVPERKSLSTLENILNFQAIIRKRKVQQANVYIFCEAIRVKEVKILAKKVLSSNFKVMPIDFDVSANRYLDPKFLVEKERVDLKYALWALKTPVNLRRYRRFFRERIDYLRVAGPKVHVKAVRKWWELKLKEFDK